MKSMSKSAKIILIVIAVLFALATAAAITMGVLYGQKNAAAKAYGKRIDTMYETTFYEVVDNMNDIERKLGKISALSKPTLQQEYLYDIWRQSGVAVSGLSRMAEEGADTESVIGFLNKTGDYCYYLSRKAETDPPSEKEINTLLKFKAILNQLNTSFAGVMDKMKGEEKIDASILSDMSAMTEAVKKRSDVDYPELIYDGPFSDGLKKRDAVFLNDKEELERNACEEKLKSYFQDAENIQMVGENSSSIASYMFSFSAGGKKGTAQITKKGGFLSEYSSYEKNDYPEYTEEECTEKARWFLDAVGYKNMTCVWKYNSDSTIYLNFAYTESGVVCYPDLIKVKVSAQTGRILGLEAQNYMYNHKERQIDGTKTTAVISDKLTVRNSRECIIPTEWSTEIRCLEVCGEYGGETYYVYYDSETGEEVEAFVVVDDLLV